MVLVGNAVVLIGAIIMDGIGFLKQRKQILLMQCVQFLIMGIGNMILGGITGFISNMISIIRNLFSIKSVFTTTHKVLFIIIQFLLSVYFNKAGFIGYLPVLAVCLLTWYLDTESENTLKIVLSVSQIMWLVYDFNILNYVGCAFDIMAIFSNLVGIYLLNCERKKFRMKIVS